jgi:hypothetical protein
MNPNGSDSPNENGAAWLSVAAAAARLGVGARAIQKRCASGTLRARRVAGTRGDVWEVEAGALSANFKANASATANVRAQNRLPDTNERELDGEREPKREPLRANVRPQNEGEVVELLRESLAREREVSNAFREQLLDANRNAAELAALREALKAQPRQLTAGDSSTKEMGQVGTETGRELEQVGTENQTARNGPESPQTFVDEQTRAGVVNAPKNAPELRETVTYASILAELEKEMNR